MVPVLREIIGLCVGEQDEVLPRSWMYSRSMHKSQCERGHCAAPKRLAKIWKWKCQKPKLTMHFIYCKQLEVSMFHKWLEKPREGSWWRHKYPVGFPNRCSNYLLGTYFQLSRIHDTLALLTQVVQFRKVRLHAFTNTSPLISSNTINQHILTISHFKISKQLRSIKLSTQ